MSTSLKKTTWLTSLGAGLEYYDFIVYGMMASTLSNLFFSDDLPVVSLLKTFGIFAIGYFVRPLGGIFFGIIGDTYGRKKTFLSVMLVMAFATIGIGLLPTYKQIGILAPSFLVFLRLLQGLSFGAELPGAITVISEYAHKDKKSIYSGFVISSVSVGSALASFVLFFLSQQLHQQQILNWGWRIPFLLGGALAIVNYFIRKHLHETPAFSKLQASRMKTSLKAPLLQLAQENKGKLFFGILMTASLASLVIFSLYFPTFLSKYFGYSSKDIYFAMTCGMVWSAFSLPICGWIADKIGRTETYIGINLCFAATAFGLFRLLNLNGIIALTIFMIIYQTIISFLSVTYFAIIATAFPTAVRYTGIAICYNVVYSVMSCAPLIITTLIESTQHPEMGIWFIISFSLIGTFGALLLSKNQPISLFEV